MREPVPHMNFVAGLDPSPSEMAERRKLTTIAVKADLAAFLNCAEADPDDQHCLIGQKLQVSTSLGSLAGLLQFGSNTHRCFYVARFLTLELRP